MHLLSTIVLILLSMVGYSSGVTLAARGKNIPPSIFDLLIVLIIWTIALVSRPQFLPILGDSRILLLLIWLIFALAIGFVKTKATYSGGVDQLPDSELPEHAKVAEVKSSNPFKRAWEGWKLFAAEMGHVQGGLFMGFFYFIVVTIFGLGVKLFSDPMAIKSTPTNSGWVDRKPLDASLAEAQEQGQT